MRRRMMRRGLPFVTRHGTLWSVPLFSVVGAFLMGLLLTRESPDDADSELDDMVLSCLLYWIVLCCVV